LQQTPTPSDTNGVDLRMDRTIKSKQSLFVRWSWKRLSAQSLTDSYLPRNPQARAASPPVFWKIQKTGRRRKPFRIFDWPIGFEPTSELWRGSVANHDDVQQKP